MKEELYAPMSACNRDTVLRLSTWQGSGFSLLSGAVEIARSEWLTSPPTPLFVDACHELWKRIGTRQFIWCSTAREDAQLWKGRTEWTLDVPRSKVLRIVDNLVWNAIIGIRCHLPETSRRRIQHAAIMRYHNNNEAYEAFLAEMETKHFPSGKVSELWDQLFLDHVSDVRSCSALVRYPVDRSYVVSPK